MSRKLAIEAHNTAVKVFSFPLSFRTTFASGSVSCFVSPSRTSGRPDRPDCRPFCGSRHSCPHERQMRPHVASQRALEDFPTKARFCSSRRAISSTHSALSSLNDNVTDSQPPGDPAKPTDGENGDECPPWQNPLHYQNPDRIRVLSEEFGPGEEMPITPLPPFSDSPDSKKVLAPPHLHDIADQIVRLNMLEVKELMDRIGDHFGFSNDVGYADGGEEEGETGGAGADEAKEEEKTAFDLKLTGFQDKAKIKVIKEVRSITSLGLKEAKELVEGAPTVVKKGIKKEEAEELKAKLEAVGGTVEIA